MSPIYIILSVLYILFCATLIGLILMQKKKTAGLTGTGNATANSQTYWGKNKARSVEGALERYTKIGGALLFIFTLLMCII